MASVVTHSDSVGCSRSHVHNGASHVQRVRVRFRFCGHYVDIVAGNSGRLRLQPTVTRLIWHLEGGGGYGITGV